MLNVCGEARARVVGSARCQWSQSSRCSQLVYPVNDGRSHVILMPLVHMSGSFQYQSLERKASRHVRPSQLQIGRCPNGWLPTLCAEPGQHRAVHTIEQSFSTLQSVDIHGRPIKAHKARGRLRMLKWHVLVPMSFCNHAFRKINPFLVVGQVGKELSLAHRCGSNDQTTDPWILMFGLVADDPPSTKAMTDEHDTRVSQEGETVYPGDRVTR